MNFDIENIAEFMPFMQTLKGFMLEIVSECHDADPQRMAEKVRDLFNKLEAAALQMPLFPDETGAI